MKRLSRTPVFWVMWSSWLTMIGTGLYDIFGFNVMKGQFPPAWVSVVLLFSLAVAIATSQTVSRRRDTEALIQVFKAGLRGSSRDDKD